MNELAQLIKGWQYPACATCAEFVFVEHMWLNNVPEPVAIRVRCAGKVAHTFEEPVKR